MSQYKFLLFGFTCIALVVLIFLHATQCPYKQTVYVPEPFLPIGSPLNFDKFNFSIGSANGEYIVPNYVHFIRFGEIKMTFIDAVCILAALKHQMPDVLFIHTDQIRFDETWGKYWDVVKRQPLARKIKVKYKQRPEEIFGQRLSEGWINWHASDVARLQVLMEYGGIYLDNDSYIVRNLDAFRRFEMTLGWQEGGNLSNQAIIAHEKARFLKLWLESYRDSYDGNQWFYNAGVKPTEDILVKKPYLIHRVKTLFAEWIGTPSMIYLDNSGVWRDHYVIHLLINHMYMLGSQNLTSEASYPVIFDEHNILKFDVNIKQMALDVYPFKENSKIFSTTKKLNSSQLKF